jgi:hypothetical protein
MNARDIALASDGQVLQNDVARGEDCVDVNSNRVRNAAGISARKRGRHWNSFAARMLED